MLSELLLLPVGGFEVFVQKWLFEEALFFILLQLNPEHLVVLLAGPIFHTSIRYVDFVEIFNVLLDLSIYFARLVGVELPLCLPVTLLGATLS